MSDIPNSLTCTSDITRCRITCNAAMAKVQPRPAFYLTQYATQW